MTKMDSEDVNSIYSYLYLKESAMKISWIIAMACELEAKLCFKILFTLP